MSTEMLCEDGATYHIFDDDVPMINATIIP